MIIKSPTPVLKEFPSLGEPVPPFGGRLGEVNYKKDWGEITEDVFKKVFQKSAVKRTKFSGLKRNIEFLK